MDINGYMIFYNPTEVQKQIAKLYEEHNTTNVTHKILSKKKRLDHLHPTEIVR